MPVHRREDSEMGLLDVTHTRQICFCILRARRRDGMKHRESGIISKYF